MGSIPSIFFHFLKHTVKFLIRNNDQSVFLMICKLLREKFTFSVMCWAYQGGYGNFIFKSQGRLAGTLKSINYILKCTASFLTREGLNTIYVKVCLTWKSLFRLFAGLVYMLNELRPFGAKMILNRKTALQDLQWFLVLNKLFIFYTYV